MEKADAHARLEAPSPRVLVLDDDERLAEMVATALRLDGYQTVVACDGAQALELVRERPFDALLTDLLMPGLKGDDVAEQASRLRPDLRLLLMTASEGVGALSVPWSAVIRKPFSLDLVVRAVAAAIGDPHRAIQGDGRLGLEGRVAHAFWLREPGSGEIRPVCLPEPGPGDVLVRTVRSGISRGTEALVFRGAVPPGQRARMRAPFQEGDFPGPVKYGYLNVGAVEEGPAELRGRTVFCLYPHQTAYVVPAGAVSVVPEDVPPARAVLAGTVETAVNALWDAGPAVGDRAAVVGGGMVGCCVARLLCRFPAVRVTLVDVDPCRAEVARALGVDFALPADAPEDLDLVVHTSATSEGLQCALGLLAAEGTVIDLSWYGDTEVRLSLGGSFHDRRLTIRSSQVGALSPTRAARRTTADRLALALELLRDPAFDVLLTGESRFGELPEVMARLAAGSLPALCHTITYGAG